MDEETKGLVKRKRGQRSQAERSKEMLIQAYTTRNPDVHEIPLKQIYAEINGPPKKLRVAAYCRVSTENDNQEGSFELQVQEYTRTIKENPDWEFVKIYQDKGISATSVDKRTAFLEMIEDCKAGKIDLILTKSSSRFARNMVDSLHYIRLLKRLNPPVGVTFTTENYNSLDETSEGRLAWLALQAQDESARKSDSIKWGIRKRYAVGIPRCPRILGYDIDEEGRYFIVEEEARFVRYIFKSYLNGCTAGLIAENLTLAGVPTITGKSPVWSPGVVIGILTNEKYCGDVIMQKTFVKDFLTHKCVKNTGQVPSYIYEKHHEPIIPKPQWEKVQRLLETKKERKQKRRRGSAKPMTITKGRLAGFMVIDVTTHKHIKRIF